jgi:hypothetical protein
MKRTILKKTPLTYTKERKEYSGGSSRNPAQPDLDWYAKPDKDIYQHTFGRVRRIKNMQITRRYENFTYKQAYTARFGPALMANLFSPGQRNPSSGLYHVSVNVIQSVIDGACARVAKSKPRAYVLPKKGNYKLKRKCKLATKYLDGTFRAAKIYENGDEVFRDACIYDQGAMLLYAEDGRIKSEALKVDEVWIDEVDGMFNKPKEIHWVHPVPRTELLSRYPKFKQQIEEARSAWRGDVAFMGQGDMVEVVRSWRVPCKEGDKDGKWAICICTATLDSGVWEKPYLPIVRFHWRTPTYGPFGDGIAKNLFGVQRAILDILRGVIKSVRMFAVPRIWVEKMANVATTTVSNEISVNTYSGQKPVFDTPPAAAPDIYQLIQWLIDWAYKQEGLSQLTAQSEKPAGLNSGVSMRTYQDIETQRFALIGQRWERFYMEVARIVIDLAADLYKEQGKLPVTVPGRGFIESIDWGDLDLRKDDYDVGVWPTNILPETPEGKLQAVQEVISSGLMPRDKAIQELDNPILNDWVEEETAARTNVEYALCCIEEEGKFMPPDQLGDIELALKLGLARYLAAPGEGLEPHKVELLLRFVQAATMEKAKRQAAMQPPPGAPPPGGGAAVGQAPAPPAAPLAPAGSGPVTMPQAA